MSGGKETYQLIEEYLNGDLAGTEKEAFEQALGQDAALQKKLETHRLANELVLEYRLSQAKSLVQQTHQGNTQKRFWRTIGFISAGLLVIGSVAHFTGSSKKTSIPKNSAPQKAKEAVTPSIQLTAPQNALENSSKAISQKLEEPTSSPATILQENNEHPMESSASVPIQTEAILPKKGEEPVESIPSPCENVHLSAAVHATAACIGEANGAISISHFEGGKAPYMVAVLDQAKQTISLIQELSAGTYEVRLTDANDCTTPLEPVTVKEKNCPKNESFNPFIGEMWQIPAHKTAGKLRVTDPNGTLYFEMDIPASTSETWSGQPNQGELKTGYFLYLLHYTDGTSKQGYITIVR